MSEENQNQGSAERERLGQGSVEMERLGQGSVEMERLEGERLKQENGERESQEQGTYSAALTTKGIQPYPNSFAFAINSSRTFFHFAIAANAFTFSITNARG